MRKNVLIITIISILFISAILPASIIGKIGKIATVTAEKIRGWDLSMKEAMWQTPLGDNLVQCNLCPYNCKLSEGQRGICGVRVNLDGKLRSMVYGKASSLNIDPVEKKPVYHFLPGTKTFSMATTGCNLGCNFCQNWTLSQSLPEDSRHRDISPSEIVSNARNAGCKSIAYTYSEPTVFYEYMYETAKLAHENNLKNIIVSCGYVNEKPLRELCKYLDAANIDLKGFTEEFYSEYTNSSLEPVKNALEIYKQEGVHLEITNLLIPGANDNPEDILRMCQFIADSLGKDTPIHFSRFHPDYKLKNKPPTPVKTLEQAYRIAKSCGLEYVYIGNVPGNTTETTFCPKCGKALISRYGYIVNDINIENGRCKFCGHEISGIWE